MAENIVRPKDQVRLIFLIALLAWLICPKAFSIDSARGIKQLYHSSWSAKDGSPTQLTGITRTSDGYLWLSSELGLFRFNGLRFEPYTPPSGVSFPSYSTLAVFGTQDGGLWVSFSPSGAAYIKGNHVQAFNQSGLELHSFAEDHDGRVWATTLSDLRYFDGSDWKIIRDPNLAGKQIWMVFCDRSGGLWTATDKGINFLPFHGNIFQKIGPPSNVQQVGQSTSGEMWMADWSGHVRPVFRSPHEKYPRGFTLRVGTSFFFDRDENLWFRTNGKGIGRLRPSSDRREARGSSQPSIDWFTSKDGLTDNFVINTSLEDVEGNIWIATHRGLNRFRPSAFAPIKMYPEAEEFTLQAADGGGVWVGSITPIPISLIREEKVLFQGPTARVASVCRDAAGLIWWGVQGGLWRQEGKRFSFFPQPKNLPPAWIWEVLPDQEGEGLWVGVGDAGLMYFKNGIWSKAHLPPGLPDTTPSATFKQKEQTTWFGYEGNRIAKLVGKQVKIFASSDGLDVGRIRAIRGSRGVIWIGGETGLQVMRNEHFTNVRTTGPEPIGKVTGIVEASDGSLWLNEIHGVLRISPVDVEQISKDPNHPVLPHKFEALDGLPGTGQMYLRNSTLLESSDHRIWVATDGGIAWTDLSGAPANTFAPPTQVTGVHTNTSDYLPSKEPSLPAGTNTVRFDYEAPSLSIPERVRFKYVLNGISDDWHDAGTAREATYNNLPPGHYQFRVIASNSDGVWNPQGASVRFSILPLFYQTLWFRIVAVLLFATLVWLVFLAHVRQSNERIESQLGARLMERDRIAREIHDTLLQGFQMLVLRFQVIADTISPDDPTRELLEDSLSRAERVLQEGRDTVTTLRSDTETGNDLAVKLAQFGRELSEQSRTPFQLTVEGNPKAIHPVVSEEIQMIAREAIANSFRHARATSIECVIQFAPRHFLFVCRDDGCGIPDKVLSTMTKDGHWGLIGMKERASKIGAVLSIARGGSGGTEVELKLTAKIAYSTKTRAGFLGLFRRRSSDPEGRRQTPLP